MNVFNHPVTLLSVSNALESKGLVDPNEGTLNLYTFKNIQDCCSLSNNFIMRLVNRIILYITKRHQNKVWLDDKTIGLTLFNELIWIQSSLTQHIIYKNQDPKFSNRYLESIFREKLNIIMKVYKDIISPAHGSQVFPIRFEKLPANDYHAHQAHIWTKICDIHIALEKYEKTKEFETLVGKLNDKIDCPFFPFPLKIDEVNHNNWNSLTEKEKLDHLARIYLKFEKKGDMLTVGTLNGIEL